MNRLLPALTILGLIWFLPLTQVEAGKPDLAARNQPSYWGENCYKTEINGEIKTYTVDDADAARVIVKGGPTQAEYDNGPFRNLSAPLNPNSGQTYGISHVIVCTGAETIFTPPADSDHLTIRPDGPDVAGVSTNKSTRADILAETGSPVASSLITGGLISLLAVLTYRPVNPRGFKTSTTPQD